MHSGGAASGELLLSDPSLLPPQAQLRRLRNPDPASRYGQNLHSVLGAYQVTCCPAYILVLCRHTSSVSRRTSPCLPTP